MANAMEELKDRMNGLEVWDHILQAANGGGFSAIDQSLVPLFKWYGIYAQKPNEEGYFMMRIKIPGGQLTLNQMQVLARLGKRYARGTIDITTRQAVQMHWLRIEDIPDIVSELQSCGMDVVGGCGDIARNITGCPLAGLHHDEYFDASDDLIEIDNHLTRNPEFSNLPRKYKLSVTACKHWCSQPDINCASLVGAEHPQTAELGYTLKIGGGLSTKPMIAKNFPVFIKRAQAKEVIEAVTKVYRDHGFRDKRHKARLKFLVDDWGVEKFLCTLEEVLGYKLTKLEPIKTPKSKLSSLEVVQLEENKPIQSNEPKNNYQQVNLNKQTTSEMEPALEYTPSPQVSHFDHLGKTLLKNGKYALGIAFISGRSEDPDFFNLVKLAEEFSDSGYFRTTNKQNLILLDIPAAKIEQAEARAQQYNLKTKYTPFTRLGVACTGTEFCNLAIVETKARAKEIFKTLDKEFPEFAEDLMISVTGCPNNCAQYSIADIGLVGCKVKDEQGNMQNAFRIFLGGRLGHQADFGKALKNRYLHSSIESEISKILNYFKEHKFPDERFSHFIDRTDLAKLEDTLVT
jgi:ferredoxin-nitrite reductase